MILSYKHNFLFIKTKKTASTSVEIALSRFCSRDDIITPISPADELLRYNLTGMIAQNFSNDPSIETRYKQLVTSGDLTALASEWKDLTRRIPFYNHMPYSEIKKWLKRDQAASLTVFTVERLPEDRIISFINYRARHSASQHINRLRCNRIGLASLVFAIAPRKSFQNYWLYSDSNGVVLDRLIRYHFLDEDLRRVVNDLGLSGELTIPKTKTSTVPKASRNALTQLERRWIRYWTAPEYAIMDQFS